MVDGISARKALRKAVRGAWDTDPALIAIQEDLKKKGYELISEEYKKCIREGTDPVQKCYKGVADNVHLAEAYRKIWGSPAGA